MSQYIKVPHQEVKVPDVAKDPENFINEVWELAGNTIAEQGHHPPLILVVTEDTVITGDASFFFENKDMQHLSKLLYMLTRKANYLGIGIISEIELVFLDDECANGVLFNMAWRTGREDSRLGIIHREPNKTLLQTCDMPEETRPCYFKNLFQGPNPRLN